MSCIENLAELSAVCTLTMVSCLQSSPFILRFLPLLQGAEHVESLCEFAIVHFRTAVSTVGLAFEQEGDSLLHPSDGTVSRDGRATPHTRPTMRIHYRRETPGAVEILIELRDEDLETEHHGFGPQDKDVLDAEDSAQEVGRIVRPTHVPNGRLRCGSHAEKVAAEELLKPSARRIHAVGPDSREVLVEGKSKLIRGPVGDRPSVFRSWSYELDVVLSTRVHLPKECEAIEWAQAARMAEVLHGSAAWSFGYIRMPVKVRVWAVRPVVES